MNKSTAQIVTTLAVLLSVLLAGFPLTSVEAQSSAISLYIDWVDTSQYPQVTVYLSDFADFETYNEAYSAYFDPESAPARTTIEVGRFPGGMVVAMDVIAHVP